MGEARRKKLAGYVPEPKPKQERNKRFVVGHADMGMASMVAMLMAAKYRGRIPR